MKVLILSKIKVKDGVGTAEVIRLKGITKRYSLKIEKINRMLEA
ncbi:MAG TPA: hypothetical protein PLA54_11265 [Spirochaetota bacterium]|nr:hypothetical protein [Spirochaetota bacterium]